MQPFDASDVQRHWGADLTVIILSTRDQAHRVCMQMIFKLLVHQKKTCSERERQETLLSLWLALTFYIF